MTLKSHVKFEEKLTSGLENDMRNFTNFHQNTWYYQNWYFLGILLSKRESAWEVMCNGTKEWWKIWRGIDLSLQNWHKEFDEFWLGHLKVSKIYTLMGYFWPKYIMFELKSMKELYFITLESDAKFEEKMTCAFRKWHKEFAKFSREHSKVPKLGLLWSPFIQSRKFMSLKFTGELCVMKMKNNANFEK